ncbi:MAG TPA: hypothetical protein VFY16_04435, partial [Gemmatimonadaceae bacterium]|nr:hypothetical protein [Gemmatimonadaceae bacterium]
MPTTVRAARTRGVVILASMVESPPAGTPCARCGSMLRSGARHCSRCLARYEDARATLQAAL